MTALPAGDPRPEPCWPDASAARIGIANRPGPVLQLDFRGAAVPDPVTGRTSQSATLYGAPPLEAMAKLCRALGRWPADLRVQAADVAHDVLVVFDDADAGAQPPAFLATIAGPLSEDDATAALSRLAKHDFDPRAGRGS